MIPTDRCSHPCRLPHHDPSLCLYIDSGHPLSQWFNPYPIWNARDACSGAVFNHEFSSYLGKEGAD